jgi:hypothetical protein
MYFGSADPLSREHLKKLKSAGSPHQNSLAERPSLLGLVDGRYTPRPAPHAVHVGGGRGHRAKNPPGAGLLRSPRRVENVSSYAEFHVSEMTEWEFLNEVVERADCGILLDVNNIYVSSKNHNFDPFDLRQLHPLARVAQIHIAGHSKFEKYILDTHDHPVIDPVWKLYHHAIRRFGPTATLLEWDDRIPSFDEVRAEALKAAKYRPAAAELMV